MADMSEQAVELWLHTERDGWFLAGQGTREQLAWIVEGRDEGTWEFRVSATN